MQLLSGGATPMESMPVWLQHVMRIVSPTPHFVAFSQAVLFRGADFSIVWPWLVAMAAMPRLSECAPVANRALIPALRFLQRDHYT
jgi:ABC-type multidrug transport system permease subunit